MHIAYAAKNINTKSDNSSDKKFENLLFYDFASVEKFGKPVPGLTTPEIIFKGKLMVQFSYRQNALQDLAKNVLTQSWKLVSYLGIW